MAIGESEGHRKLSAKIAVIFGEVRSSNAIHRRKHKELLALRSQSPVEFCAAFCEALAPLFSFQRRTTSSERIIKFVCAFACSRSDGDDAGDGFLENFLRFLLVASAAANKTPRFRACQIVSEIIMRLPDDMEVSSELWDEVIECMKLRAGDKVPAVRTFAIRSLVRFANDAENSDILNLFLEKLPLEQNGDVRKILVLSLPPSSETLSMITDCTLDVNESVRKAAYCVLASKFPIQSLSIKLRATILQRGLAERSVAVAKECFKMMKDEWLDKCCNGDPVQLLKFLDVETYESVGETVMSTLLKAGLAKLKDGQTLRNFITPGDDSTEGQCNFSIELMDAETAVFWRMVCKHLHMEAHKKGSDAAMTTGTESTVYAEEASDNNDLLDIILPASISDYVELVNAHIAAGVNHRFVSRQLLLLGAMLDFSDVSNRKVASGFVQVLLHKALDHELDENGNEVIIGDGFNLGGERNWAAAVAELGKKVHAAAGEFKEVVLTVVEELAQPCRERTADWKQWLHCLAVVGLLLENTTSFRHMQGKAIDPTEILHSLLLPGAKHSNLDVQRASVRCLGLFCLLERKPSENIVKQLRSSFVKGPSIVTIMASKALLDLATWHGSNEMDKAMNCNLLSQLHGHEMPSTPAEFGNGSEDMDIELLDLLCAGLEHDWDELEEVEENHSIQDVLGEGLAKILLLSSKFPGSHASHQFILAKIIKLYFNSENKEFQRLKQCLSVFFEHYPSLSINHKKCLSKAFMPVMRSLWPGINGNAAGSSVMISNMRKRAAQASRFMLHMMQAPLLAKETTTEEDNKNGNPDVVTDPSLDFESGEEGLAVQIAVEVASFHAKKTAAEKSYVAALCKILTLLQFRVSEQDAVKLMRRILSLVIKSVSGEKDLLKEVRHMAERLKAIDRNPEEQLSSEQTTLILEKLGLSLNLDGEDEGLVVSPTPAVQSTRPRRARRRARDELESSSDDEVSPTSVVPFTPAVINSRSQRASKTAAMTKIAAKTTIKIDEYDDSDGEDDGVGEVTSEDNDSDASL